MQTEPRSFQTNSRHVRVKWAFSKQENDKELLKPVHCPTEKMRADLLTKPKRDNNVFKEHDSAILQGTRMSQSHVEGHVEYLRKRSPYSVTRSTSTSFVYGSLVKLAVYRVAVYSC